MPGTVEGGLAQRIFINYRLLELLIQRCLDDDEKLTLDEVRLIARAFSAMPIEVIQQERISIFDQDSVDAHERNLQEEADKNPSMRLPLNRGDAFKPKAPEVNLMSMLNALANIVSRYNDATASYFALYTVFNLIYTINLLAPTVNGQHTISKSLQTKGPIDLTDLRIDDMDYQMLTSCLLRSRVLTLALEQPTRVEADADIMRVCTKLVTTLAFKAARNRILMGEVEEGPKLTP